MQTSVLIVAIYDNNQLQLSVAEAVSAYKKAPLFFAGFFAINHSLKQITGGSLTGRFRF